MAFPRSPISADDELVARLGAVVDEESVDLVVVGRPVALSGNETASTELADALCVALAGALSVPVVQFDERLTTLEAKRSLSEAGVKARDHRERVDSAAAVVMLQHFLESDRAS